MQFVNKLILTSITVILSGCGGRTPPGGTNISSKPYYVRGRYYYPQQYYEYDQIGLASWYGVDFHGQKTASGHRFNKNGYSAAHRTLPLPTVVRVTNLRNGRSIVLVVDDRGPYTYKGRIIDLSYAAAKKLDILRFKPSKVRVQSLPRESRMLSNYIRRYCINRKDPKGRSWTQLYYQEIRPRL